MNDAERDLYEARLKFRRDEAARTAYALNEGFEKGRAQGHEVGREEGREEGREIGRHEGQAEGVRFAVLRVGQLRFGPASESTQEKLRAITALERLEQLTERILTVSEWDELFRDNTPPV